MLWPSTTIFVNLKFFLLDFYIVKVTFADLV